MNPATKLLMPILASCFLWLGLAAQSALAMMITDEPSGFRGNQWGAAPSDCASLRFVKEMGTTASGKRVDIYDRSAVGIVLNGATLTRIRYRFLDNHLESVQLSFEGRANRDKLLQLMEERYGRLTPGEHKFVWKAEWEGYETVVDLSYNTETGTGSLWFLSTDLNRDFVGSGY